LLTSFKGCDSNFEVKGCDSNFEVKGCDSNFEVKGCDSNFEVFILIFKSSYKLKTTLH